MKTLPRGAGPSYVAVFGAFKVIVSSLDKQWG